MGKKKADWSKCKAGVGAGKLVHLYRQKVEKRQGSMYVYRKKVRWVGEYTRVSFLDSSCLLFLPTKAERYVSIHNKSRVGFVFSGCISTAILQNLILFLPSIIVFPLLLKDRRQPSGISGAGRDFEW